MRIARTRPNVLTITATGAELAALTAGARMAFDLLALDPRVPAATAAALGRVLDDYDAALARVAEGGETCTSRS